MALGDDQHDQPRDRGAQKCIDQHHSRLRKPHLAKLTFAKLTDTALKAAVQRWCSATFPFKDLHTYGSIDQWDVSQVMSTSYLFCSGDSNWLSATCPRSVLPGPLVAALPLAMAGDGKVTRLRAEVAGSPGRSSCRDRAARAQLTDDLMTKAAWVELYGTCRVKDQRSQAVL